MKSIVLIAIVLVITIMAVAPTRAEFYYGSNGTIAMETDSSKVLVKCDITLTPSQRDDLLGSVDRIAEVIPDPQPVDEFVVCSLFTGQGYGDFLDSLQAVEGIAFVESYYQLEDGSPLYIGQSFCVAFDSLTTPEQIDSLNAEYSVSIVRELLGMPGVYLLLNSESSGHRTLELANMYHNLLETRYAHPNFGFRVKKMTYSLYDYYADYQPHTRKVIGQFNQASVWDFAGLTEPITVAVIDDGVTSHEDMPPARILAGYDVAGGSPDYVPDNDPTPGPDQAHGMACAGIIGASHTTDPAEGQLSSSGVISLDPNILITPIKLFDDNGGAPTNDRVAEAVAYAYIHGADLLSCSWGYGSPTFDYPALTEALERAALFGRGGRGCPVIFAAGNDDYWYNGVSYPANLDQCFAVGATELDDDRWYYSQYGPGLDLVAPSDDGYTVGVWSMDQMGNLGWNPGSMSDCPPGNNDIDYDCHFGGTSAACPVVSGTAALLLAKDSTLSAQAVYYILRHSAQTDLDWGTITPPNTEYGYGRVDAFRAVLSISHKGDFNNNGSGPNIQDLTFLVAWLFSGGAEPFPSRHIADWNCDGAENVADLTAFVAYLFDGGVGAISPCFEY